MSMAAVFLDIEKAFDTTWHPGLLHKLPELEFLTSLIKFITSFRTNRKFKVLVHGKFSTPQETATGVPQGSVLAPILYNPYINDAPAASRTHFAPFADNTCIYTTE
jgi:hypothetical protein